MNLHEHLALLDQRAACALAITDGTAPNGTYAAFIESLGLASDDDIEDAAWEYLDSGYPFTPAPGSAAVAVLAVGGPEIHLARHGDGYVLTGYMPGHRDAVRGSDTITRWGRLRDTQEEQQ